MTYIFDILRTPIGKANGCFKSVLPEDLFASLLNQILKNTHISSDKIDKVIAGNAFGTGGNMTRYASLKAGFAENTDAFTIDSQCSGGLKSLEIADAFIKAKISNLIIAGGMESKSLAPKKFYNEKDERYTSEAYEIAKFYPNQNSETPMLDAAERVALKYGISKEEMIEWTINSHLKALKAKGFMEEIIHKTEAKQFDQSIKSNTENIRKLSSEHLIDFTTSAHFNDAAAAILVGSEEIISTLKIKPKAKILAVNSVGINPEFAPEGILDAIKPLLKLAPEVDLFEINESFALIPLIFAHYFNISKTKINIFGGNLAYGHPFGASGTINLMHLILALEKTNKKYGIVAVPAAGGLATAMLIERYVD